MKSKNEKGNLIPVVYSFLSLYKYMNPLCMLCSLIMFCLAVLQTLYFIERQDLKFFLQYAQFYFCTIFAFNVNFLYPFAMNIFGTTIKNFSALFVVDVSCIRPKTLRQITKLVKHEEFRFIVWIVVTFSVLVLLEYSWAQNRERYMTLSVLLKQHMRLDSVGAQVIHWGIHLLFLQLALPSIAVPTYFVYFIFHLKLQLIMLIEYVDTFNHNGESLDPKHIIMKIRYIIEKHVEIKRYSVRATEHSQLFIYTLYMVNGVFLGVISIYSIISPEVNTRDGIAMFFAYFMYSYGNCDCVQSYMDLSMTLVDSIYNLKWYQWNTQCNKMYIILLTNASRGLKISIFLIINISNDLFKEICRITYGFANFFLSFTARK